MKNVLAGAVAAAVLSSGLVAAAAHADEAPPCPTDGCNAQPTVVAVGIGKPAGTKSLVKAKVVATSSSSVPAGDMLLKVVRREQAAEGNTLVPVAVRRRELDDHGKVRFHVRLRQPGRYRFSAEYTQPEDQGGGSAVGFGSFRVTKK